MAEGEGCFLRIMYRNIMLETVFMFTHGLKSEGFITFRPFFLHLAPGVRFGGNHSRAVTYDYFVQAAGSAETLCTVFVIAVIVPP